MPLSFRVQPGGGRFSPAAWFFSLSFSATLYKLEFIVLSKRYVGAPADCALPYRAHRDAPLQRVRFGKATPWGRRRKAPKGYNRSLPVGFPLIRHLLRKCHLPLKGKAYLIVL